MKLLAVHGCKRTDTVRITTRTGSIGHRDDAAASNLAGLHLRGTTINALESHFRFVGVGCTCSHITKVAGDGNRATGSNIIVAEAQYPFLKAGAIIETKLHFILNRIENPLFDHGLVIKISGCLKRTRTRIIADIQ